jgi:hypothetical protein
VIDTRARYAYYTAVHAFWDAEREHQGTADWFTLRGAVDRAETALSHDDATMCLVNWAEAYRTKHGVEPWTGDPA